MCETLYAWVSFSIKLAAPAAGGGASLWVPENAVAEGLRVEKRIES